MYIYNITFGVDAGLEREVVFWLAGEFFTDSCETGLLRNPELLRVVGRSEPGTVSLAVRFEADTLADIENWYSDCGSRLFADALSRWPQRVAFFPTTLEVVVP